MNIKLKLKYLSGNIYQTLLSMYINMIKKNYSPFYRAYRSTCLEYIWQKQSDIEGTTHHEAWNTPDQWPGWECEHDRREFHSNELYTVFQKKVWG